MMEFNEDDFALFAQAALHALHDYNPDSGYETLIDSLGDDLNSDVGGDSQ